MPKPHGSSERIRGITTTSRGLMIWSTNGPVYGTLNGTSWLRVMAGVSPVAADIYHPTSSNRYFGPSLCEFDSKVYLYMSAANKLYVAEDGFNFVEQQNLNPFARMTSVPAGLIGIEGTIGWFSPDGTTWQQFSLPHQTAFLYDYHGSLVAYSPRGIYQAGVATSMAPITSVRNLGENQSLAQGSMLSLDYSVLDPEDRFERVEIYLNGVRVVDSNDAEGQSEILVSGTGRQVVEIRSYDQDGQISVDYWQLTATSHLPDKVVETASTTAQSATVWEGRLQIGIDQELFALFPEGWVSRSMPFSTPSADFIFGPDVMLAVGPNLGFNRNVLASTDGISWRGLDFAAQSIRHEDGWFLARNYRAVSSSSTVGLAVSRDGISWRTANTGNLGAAAGNGFIVALSGSGFQHSTIRISEDGATWNSHPGGDMKHLAFESGFFFGIGNQSFKRSVDGRSWVDLSPPLASTETIQHLDIAGGFLYLLTSIPNVRNSIWLSNDQGETWEKLTDTPTIPRQVSYGNGIWFCVASNGIYSSTNGKTWMESISVAELYSATPWVSLARGFRLHAHESGVSLLTNKIWTTRDGLEWYQDETPLSGGSLIPLTEPVILDASAKVTIMQNRLILSLDGVDWKQCPLTVSPGKSPRWSVIHDGELLVYASAFNGVAELWRSSDGMNFTEASLSEPLAIQFLEHDGSRFFVRGWINGVTTHLTSADGVNWVPVFPPVNTGTIRLLNETLIVIAPRVTGNPGRQDIHYSVDGIAWQTKELTNGDIQSLSYGNGIFLGSQSANLWTGTSIDNLTSLTSSVSPHQGKLAFAHESFILMTPQGVWRSQIGQSWEAVYSSLTGNLEVLNGTAYLRATSTLRPLLPPDLQLQSVTSVPANLAVGDEFIASVALRNIGLSPMPEGAVMSFHGIITRDGILGNGDDIMLGVVETVLDAGLSVGESANLDLTFELPALEAGGQFKLAVLAHADVAEMTRANNIAVTGSTVIEVDEFVLNLTQNGEGQVDQSMSALRYANGTLVTLNALAASGSGFEGWSGSRVTPFGNITVLMNQDQSLTANFAAIATLQLSIQGSGEVDGWAEPGTYPIGSNATLTAQASPGWEFAGWSGGVTSTNPTLSLVMNEDTSVIAVFRQIFEAWQALHFSDIELADPLISGADADADRDGMTNWQEYLHGSNPLDKRSRGVLQSGLDGGFIHIVYTRNTGIAHSGLLACEGTRDLRNWNADDLEKRVISVEDGIETIEARMPNHGPGNEQGFLRLKYERP